MKLSHTLFALPLLLAGLCAEAANYLSHRLDGQRLEITSDEGRVSLTLHNGQALEVFYQPNGVKQLPSFAVAGLPQAVSARLADKADSLRFGSDSLTAVIHKSPLRIDYEFHNKPLVSEEVGLFVQDALRGFRFTLDAGEKILGGGERVLGMDRRGQRLPLYNKAHYGYSTESAQMYYSLPAVVSSDKYLLAFDNSASGTLDIGATEKNILQFEAVGGRTAYLLVAGQTYPDLLDHYTQLTGRQPLPPRWAFGNFASRFGYHSEQEVRDTLQKFHDTNFPLDALVLDLYWFGKDVQGHMGNLAWDREAFPNPEQMLADLNADGVNPILITEPFVLTSSKRWDEAVAAGALAKNAAGQPKTFNFYFGNTGLLDLFNRQAQDWFWAIYADLHRQGVAGWWGDLGEPEVHPDDSIHDLNGLRAGGDVQGCTSAADAGCVGAANEVHNAYGHQWAQLVYERSRQDFPATRPLVLMRAGFLGSQRYGMIPWTGDVSRDWGGLQPQVELSLSMGLLGLGYTHSDLGGFAGGETFDQELYLRWLQYGVFQPVYRPHAQENIAPEPVFHDQKTQDLIRPFVQLRYRLLPYNYSLAMDNSLTGLPLMRPLFFEDEKNLPLMDNAQSYLWGDAFLVTPVTQAGVQHLAVQLPKGVWFDYFTGDRYSGGRTIQQPTSIDTLPVLVRAGSFVPMVETVGRIRDYSSQQLTLHYWADASVKQAHGKMHEDDGRDPLSLAKNRFETLRFAAKQTSRNLRIALKHKGQYEGMPATRDMTLVVHNQVRKPRRVLVAGQAVAFDYQAQTLTVKFAWHHQPINIELL